jgi:hypothetical protein
MRGPRPPDGLLTSETIFIVWSPRPVFQVRLTVTRRKSSGWMSGSSVPAAAGTGACGVQTSAGGVVAMLSFGSSKVQTLTLIVYLMPRREISHGVPDPPTFACRTLVIVDGLSES